MVEKKRRKKPEEGHQLVTTTFSTEMKIILMTTVRRIRVSIIVVIAFNLTVKSHNYCSSPSLTGS